MTVILKILKKYVKRMLFGYRADSEAYIAHMKKIGARVGERVQIFSSRHVLIDMTRPWLIEIGNDVQITHGVIILTHGFDWSVIKGKYGEVLGSSGKVKLGNNVFIGMNSIILKGVTVGDDVIIGAGSVITKDVPSGTVVAGNPARVIRKF